MKSLLCALALSLPLCAQVKVTLQGKESIQVEIGGKPFTQFFIGPDTQKPYLHPLRSATGKVVTRAYPMENIPGENHDHPHHRGLWFTHGAVNGYDFWGNEPDQKGAGKGKGKVVLKTIDKVSGGRKSGLIAATFDWVADGQALLSEERRMTFYDVPNMRVFDVDIILHPDTEVTFGDTKEGTFAIRLAAELEEEQPKKIPEPKRTGRMVNAVGKQTEKQVWGTRSEWVDYFGSIGGEKLGIAILDNPGNPRHPTYWHSRAYGLFAANPFGVSDFERDKSKNGNLTIQVGQPLRFRYRVIIHPGNYQSANIAEMYKDYEAGKRP
ncbi:MAG TPA: PmoA family protein [Bryobacteraceae bacterium]|nr:PmoA family protein [Bryobacteraceae bacterium]